MKPMSLPSLQSFLSERFEVHGTFCPQSYAIGLLQPIDEVMRDLPAYPLSSAEELQHFKSALVLYHEATHFAQFISTSFGLQMARMTNICVTRIFQHGPWKLPILASYTDIDGEDLDRFFAFKYLTESLSTREETGPVPAGVVRDTVTLLGEPASPAYYVMPQDTDVARRMEAVRAGNAQIHAEYHLLRPARNGQISDTTLNTAALMEGYAQLAEMHHIGNAMRIGLEEHVKLIDTYPPIYTAALLTYLVVYRLPLEFLVLHLAALIDIALMYSPHIVYNIGPCHRLDHGGANYRTPAEIFIDACAAAQAITPIKDHSSAEVQRFQDAVCKKMGIQGTREMTDLCLERLAKIGVHTRSDCERILIDPTPLNMMKVFAVHWLGLNYRRERGAGFCADLLKTDYLLDILDLARRHVTFFDLESRAPHEFHPGRIFSSSQGTLIWDALHNARLECPLKQGQPYFCPGAQSVAHSLCVFFGRDEDAKDTGMATQQECILDIFEGHAQIRPR